VGSALAAVLGWPVLATVLVAVRGPGGAAMGGAARPARLALTTVRLAIESGAIAVPIGVGLAFALFRTDAWGRRGLIAMLAWLAFVPMPLHASAWLGGFGNAGRSQALGSGPILAGLDGAAFVHAMAAIPWVVLLAGAGLRLVEPGLEEAAWLERSAGRAAIGVGLRRARGAIAGAALAVAVLAAGDMTVTDLLGVRTYAEEAYLQFQVGRGPAAAAAVALPPLLVLGPLIWFAIRRYLDANAAGLADGVGRAKTWRLGRWRVPAGMMLMATAGNFLAWPLYALIWRAGRVGGSATSGQAPGWSFAGLAGTLGRAAPDVARPLAEGAAWAAIGASLAVPLAWALAWLARRPGGWRVAVAGSMALALALPGPVAGMGLVLAYRDDRFIYDTPAILVLAHVLRTFPFALLVIWPAARSIPTAYLESAEVDGLGGWGRLRRVVWPSTRGASATAWWVAFALAIGELPAANLVAPPGTSTLPVLVWGLLHTGVESRLAGVVLVALAALGLVGLAGAWGSGAFRGSGSRTPGAAGRRETGGGSSARPPR